MREFQLEYRGYQTSAWAASALGWANYVTKGNMIWNSSWAAVDDKAITKHIIENYKYKDGKPYQETTPHNPWNN